MFRSSGVEARVAGVNENVFGELLAASNRLVHGLRALGLEKDDVVATLLPNGDPPGDWAAGGIMTYTAGTTGRPKGVRRPLMPIDPDTGGQMFFTWFQFLYGIQPKDDNVHSPWPRCATPR